MAISPEMQGRVEKIEKLIEDGYTLKKTSLDLLTLGIRLSKWCSWIQLSSGFVVDWLIFALLGLK